MKDVPPFHGNISFNAQHSPKGAFFSFTCGHFHTRGGMSAEIGKPANQDLYIGIKDGDRFSDAPLRCLPFFHAAAASSPASDYAVEQAGPAEQSAKPNVITYRREEIARHYGWATDQWVTNHFRFSIYTPFTGIPDPTTGSPDEMRNALCPAILADLVVTNTTDHTQTAFFAANFNAPGWLPLEKSVGFTHRDQLGLRVHTEDGGPEPFLFCRWTVNEGLREPVAHRLGSVPGVGVEIPPGRTRTLRIAIGCYLGGVVTTGLEGRYLYTRYFTGLADVLDHALRSDAQQAAARLDRQLLSSGLSSDQQFLIAHATRSYYGSTQLLDVAGEPMWVVNEGEYCMMNTLDLAVDQMFWELRHNPWVVRNLLDHFVRRYSYVDQVKDHRSGETKAGGISFCHDMGAHNNFTPPGHSSYELPDLTGCFSYMTAEQLCNWCLIAATYAHHTRDRAWIEQNLHIIDACLTSLVNRGGEAGFCQYDSTRCASGSEITTYDSLDHSLAQTRANVYMASKTWATYLGLARLLEEHLPQRAGQARQQAQRVETHVLKHAGPDGVLPAVFERDNPGHRSRILPAAEGLLYPLMWGETRTTPLHEALRQHTIELLRDPERRNLFADGGIRLSATSNNSWMSKIAIFQHVARRVFRLHEDEAIRVLFSRADAAHVKWQTEGESSYWACSDQMVNGVAKASRYYPRIITSALWMDGPGDE